MGQKTILFGASKLGYLAYDYLKDIYDICYYCDNDEKKVGTFFNGLEVISKESLVGLVENKNYYVIISSHHFKEIGEQLKSYGINEDKFKIFKNSLEYLHTLYNIERRKEEIKKEVSLENIKINRNIFSGYNLHLMIDSIYTKTFIEDVNRECNKKNNLFIIYTNNGMLKYSDVDKYDNVEVIDLNNSSIYANLNLYVYGCNKLFIHFLSDDVCELLDNFDIKNLPCKIYWKLWGADLYNYIDFNLYEEKTYEFIKDKEYYRGSIKPNIDNVKLESRKRVIKEVDYVLTTGATEYQLILENFETKAKLLKLGYKINIDFKQLEDISIQNNMNFRKRYNYKYLLLVGNSATFENNHLEIFYKLKDFQDCGVVLPMSYGNKSYAKDIINEGIKTLGDRLIILDEYLEPSEYYNIINQVDAVIMNHLRSQGVGNILGAMYLGKPIYLNNKSNLKRLFNEYELITYDIESMDVEELQNNNHIDSKIIRQLIKKVHSFDYKEVLL